jgi:hypothetical protein
VRRRLGETVLAVHVAIAPASRTRHFGRDTRRLLLWTTDMGQRGPGLSDPGDAEAESLAGAPRPRSVQPHDRSPTKGVARAPRPQ